jgi:hypothetical protein
MATKEDDDVDEVSSGVGKSCRGFAKEPEARNAARNMRHPGPASEIAPLPARCRIPGRHLMEERRAKL